MSNPVKTSGDWMSLFLGSASSSRYSTGAGGGSSDYLSSRTRSRPSEGLSRGDVYNGGGQYSRVDSYNSSRSYYGGEGYSGSSYSRVGITSPTTFRAYPRNTSTTLRSTSSYTSRWSEPDEEDLDDDHKPGTGSAGNNAAKHDTVQHSKSRSTVTILNEGAIVIRRAAPASDSDSSDDDDDDEADPEDERQETTPTPPTPPRDPLEVEEEELTEKLQTAGFLMSLPEEEEIRKRLVEIKQMRDNPDLFKPENSRDWKFCQVSLELAKPSVAREEEEKILMLRLSSRGITEVEQTDVQVRLQEIWRDRKEELHQAVSRLEQEYEHLLSESSTEVAELDGSIRGKQAAILKMQEDILVLSLKKDKVAKDMEKVEQVHQTKLDQLKAELEGLEDKSSQYSIVSSSSRLPPTENSLPEAERSEIEAELECPVCLEISLPPIYQCGEGHIVCSACKPLLKACSLCEAKYADPPIRCRFAEKLAAKYFRHHDEE